MKASRAVPIVLTVALALSPAGASVRAPGLAERIRLDPREAEAVARAALLGPTAALRTVLRAQALDVAPAALGRAPRALPDALAYLGRALAVAEDRRARALAGVPAAVARDAWAPVPAPSPALPSAGVARVAAPSAGPWTVGEAARAAAVDQAGLRRAAVTLVSAVETAASALEPTAPAALTVPSHCGVSGTMVFESGDCSVVVGATGSNTYPAAIDPVLLIDLGGDDTYTNATAFAQANVRLAIDVSGNDTYTRASAVAAAGADVTVGGQAAGLAGVGVLADLGGNDRYTASVVATSPEPGPVPGTATVLAQGAGSIGAGVLVDLSGLDSYAATATSSGGNVAVTAQGGATLGLGALLDLGSPTEATADPMDALATSTLHVVTQTPGLTEYAVGPAAVVAQGAGVLGAGGAVGGPGNDTYNAVATGAVSAVTAQGGVRGGAGLLADAAGDDRMTARATGDTSLSLITTDPSFCWHVFVNVITSASSAFGQGGGTLGAAVLADGAGNDVRTLDASSRASAIAEARSNFNCAAFGNTATANAQSGGAEALGQGGAGLGASALVDLLGDDTNNLSAASNAYARALAISPGPNGETATATSGAALTEGQGRAATGLGLSLDGTGADRYAAVAGGSADRVTSAGTISTPSPAANSVQGHGGTGAGWLIDLDGVDTYTSSPTATLAANNKCWSNAGSGRGRDLQAGQPPPSTCP